MKTCECLDPFHQGQPCGRDANADEAFGDGKTVSSPALCAACAYGCDEFNGPQAVAK